MFLIMEGEKGNEDSRIGTQYNRNDDCVWCFAPRVLGIVRGVTDADRAGTRNTRKGEI
jgi:hypothetical protein